MNESSCGDRSFSFHVSKRYQNFKHGGSPGFFFLELIKLHTWEAALTYQNIKYDASPKKNSQAETRGFVKYNETHLVNE